MRLAFTISALALAVFGPSAAQAQGTDEFGAYGGLESKSSETGQDAAFELRFGPYPPSIDDEFSGARPFEDTFGTDTRWLVGIELDWQALRIPSVGTLGPGVGVGFTSFSAKAPLASGTGRSEEETSLEILPMYLVGVLRVDIIARETDVPLVPWAKLGAGFAFWWASDASGTARDDRGRLGRDTSYGWQYALGAGLLLDDLDPDAAIGMDASTGVNNSYLFIEYYSSNLDGFGGSSMNVGSTTWMAGLALEI